MKVIAQEDITEYIKANPQLSAKEIAENFGYSQFHFSREFKKIMGVSLREFLSANKLDQGTKTLVTEDNVTNAQIDAGYENIGAFSHNFKRFTGYSPKKHIKNIINWVQYIHALSSQSYAEPILYKFYDTQKYQQPYPLRLKVANRHEDSLIFIGLFTQSIPKVAPVFGVCLRYGHTYSISSIPNGWYYAMVIEVLLHQKPSYYLSPYNFRRDICYVPVVFPQTNQSTQTLTLREEHINDPPVILHPLKLLFDIIKPPKN